MSGCVTNAGSLHERARDLPWESMKGEARWRMVVGALEEAPGWPGK